MLVNVSYLISDRGAEEAQGPDPIPVAAVAIIPSYAKLAALSKVKFVQPRTLALAFAPSLASFAFAVPAISLAAIPSFAALSFALAPALAPITLAFAVSFQVGVCCRAIFLLTTYPVTTVTLVSAGCFPIWPLG